MSQLPDPAEAQPEAATGEPAAAAGAVERVERPHPLTPFVRGWVVLLAVAFSVGREFLPFNGEPRELPPLQFILGAVALLAVGSGVIGFFTWRFTRFVIDAEQLRLDTGVLFRRSQRVAFDKVQSIDVVQPFAARLFGLAELQIDIGTSERPRLRYLSRTRAYALRDYLLARARGVQAEAAEHADAGSVLVDLGAGDEVLVSVPPQTLLLAAATSHEFFSIIATGVLATIVGVSIGQFWVVFAFGIPMVSVLFSYVVRRVTSQFNYTLSRRPHGLRISRGLTSLTSQSLPPRRVQALQLTQSLLWRRLGLYRIDLEVIGWGQVSDNESSSGVSTTLLPAGSIEQVRTAIAAIWPHADFESVELHAAPTRARWLHPLAQPFLRWGHDGALVVARHGWLVRRWQLVPHARIQSVQITQGLLSRRLGLADLEFHTAGGHLAPHASGLDAGAVLQRQAELLAQVHRPPARDISEPDDGAQPGPEALRADQAEATISSTE